MMIYARCEAERSGNAEDHVHNLKYGIDHRRTRYAHGPWVWRHGSIVVVHPWHVVHPWQRFCFQSLMQLGVGVGELDGPRPRLAGIGIVLLRVDVEGVSAILPRHHVEDVLRDATNRDSLHEQWLRDLTVDLARVQALELSN